LRLLMAFGAGILISLTPCVYPLIPITAAIVSGKQTSGETGVLVALVRSVVYVLGLALVYATLGALSASLGGAFSRWLKTAWVLVPVSAIFVVLGLSMFELFTIQTPAFITNRVSVGRSGGRIGNVFVMGLVAGIVATPCIAAPLAGMLTFIATTGNRLLGFWMLFSLAWGMGLILIAVGTFTGSMLPKSGDWMVWIRKLFGFVMLWAAAYFATPVIGPAVYQIISAVVIVAAVVFLGGLDTLSVSSGFAPRFKRTVGIVAIIFAVLLFVNAADKMAGDRLGTTPGSRQPEMTAFRNTDYAGLGRARSSGRATVVDVYAEWCSVCKKLERDTLSRPEVAAELSTVNALRLDYDRNPELVDEYDILGIPVILFFDTDGSERSDLRLSGFVGPDQVLAAIEKIR